MDRTILLSLLVIGIVVAMVGGGTLAYFSDDDVSQGNLGHAGTMVLRVMPSNKYEDGPIISKIVDLDDLMPAERQTETVKLKNEGDADGVLYLRVVNIQGSAGTDTEQEESVGGLDINDIQNWIDMDLSIDTDKDGEGDSTLVNGILANMEDQWIPITTLTTKSPDDSVVLELGFSLKPETSDAYQGDECTFDIEMLLQQTNAPSPSNL